MTRALLASAAALLALVPSVRAQQPARGEAALREAMLRAHNSARARVGIAPLAWDERLVADARAHAAFLARTGRFQHSTNAGSQGENLWTGTRGRYGYAEMASGWIEEQRDFVNQPSPRFSRTGNWMDVAHYTQIVWRGTRRLGCAIASGTRDDYLVCRYDPGGNVDGQRAF